jgi:hypothetical protein
MQMQHCNNYQNNQDLSLPSGSNILPIIDPAERVRYIGSTRKTQILIILVVVAVLHLHL